MRTVAVVSGGMDSVTLAYKLAREGHDLALLSVDYGQRHVRELECARRCAERLGVSHEVADLSGITRLISDSVLTDHDRDVPEGHYAAPTMRQTVVPNRNMIMLSVAVGYAANIGAEMVATGVHAGDHPVYPDCRPVFIDAVSAAAAFGTQGLVDESLPHKGVRVVAPFVRLSKASIAAIGKTLGVPFADTWSCYKGGEIHCGRCSTCVERIEALDEAGVEDTTPYADATYWRSVV